MLYIECLKNSEATVFYIQSIEEVIMVPSRHVSYLCISVSRENSWIRIICLFMSLRPSYSPARAAYKYRQ